MIKGGKWRFTREMIADAPAHPGLYALWDGEQLLRLGCARGRDTIRGKLLAHLEAGGERPTHYSWEITVAPVQRAREILSMMPEGGAA